MDETQAAVGPGERALAYRVLRYASNLVRDEWVNIGILLFDPDTGERRLRMIEGQDEFARVRRLHPAADDDLLRALRDDLEDRLQGAANGGPGDWLKLLAKWDDTLSNALQLAPQIGLLAQDLDAEVERLYADHVAPPRAPSRMGAPGSRATIRDYCGQVWKLARLWDRLDKSVRVAEFTMPGDPMRLDYSYRRNGTRGYVQTLSVSRAPADCKLYAYTAARIAARASFASEFAAVTDVPLRPESERHRFVRDTLRDAGIEPVAMEGFAVWVNKLKPLLLQ
ncbi:MAG TPA: DUF3037 domain-containing protein [Candidatus Dormibacteraeota bacterium]|nr:DUF3037 domain-containing protein [Candidatus Dormibacteraeota bacterium]